MYRIILNNTVYLVGIRDICFATNPHPEFARNYSRSWANRLATRLRGLGWNVTIERS